jgi:hypothetical protein
MIIDPGPAPGESLEEIASRDHGGATHVHPKMRDFLAIPGRERIARSWDRVYVPTSSTREAFVALKDCLNAMPSVKPEGLVIHGKVDTGKSRTMEAFRNAHPPVRTPGSEYVEHPVIYIEAPDRPDLTIVYLSILRALERPIGYNAKPDQLRIWTVRMIRSCKVGVIMMDELHDISRERMSNQLLDFFGSLKNFINETRRPFVIGGVDAVLTVLSRDEQLASRFENAVELRRFGKEEFKTIVRAFERLMPLHRRSDFQSDDALVEALYQRSDRGLIGRLSRLLEAACRTAIDTGEERITIDVLDKVPVKTLKQRDLDVRRGRESGGG